MPLKKTFLLLALAIAVSYSTALPNRFIGDDVALFVGNNFYKDPHNLTKLFSRDFITRFSDIDAASMSGQKSFSGCVAYRPVTALSFFFDYFIWKLNPFGFHLTNVLLHFLVVCQIYLLVSVIVKNEGLALLTSGLFAVHPINAEVVNYIGYRSDLLAVLFYLLALRSFIRSATDSKTPFLGYGAFLLALLSKEIAVTLPVVLVIYDVLFSIDKRNVLKKRKFDYLTIGGILLFYLYLYFIAFPNSNAMMLTGFKLGEQLIIAAKILVEYLAVLLFPWKVTVLPPLYTPALESVGKGDLVSVGLFILTAVFLVVRYWKKKPAIAFFTIWFFVTYLPPANFMPVPNPFAFRFMYLPAIGFFILWAMAFEKILEPLSRKEAFQTYGRLIKFIILAGYVSLTIPLNSFFRDARTACHKMVLDYPDSSRPYLILGTWYYQKQKFSEAIQFFKKYLEVDPRNRFVSLMKQEYVIHHQIGACYVDDPDQAIAEFKKSIALRPDYAAAYADLAAAHIIKGQYSEALNYALAAIRLNDKLLPGYAYAIISYTKLGDTKAAKGLLAKAAGLFPNDPGIADLQEIISRSVPTPPVTP